MSIQNVLASAIAHIVNGRFSNNSSGKAPVRVLVVDDEPAIRDLIQRSLRQHAEVRTVDSAHKAIENVDCSDILVLDWMFNGKPDGEVIMDVWMQRNGGPICVMSGQVEMDRMQKLYSMGAQNVLSKPFETSVLVSIVLYYIHNVRNLFEIANLTRRLAKVEKLVIGLTIFCIALLIVAIRSDGSPVALRLLGLM